MEQPTEHTGILGLRRLAASRGRDPYSSARPTSRLGAERTDVGEPNITSRRARRVPGCWAPRRMSIRGVVDDAHGADGRWTLQ